MNNAVFEKNCGKCEKTEIKIKIVTTEKRKSYLVSDPNYENFYSQNIY